MILIPFLGCNAYISLDSNNRVMHLKCRPCLLLSRQMKSIFTKTRQLLCHEAVQYDGLGITSVHINLRGVDTQKVLEDYGDAMFHLFFKDHKLRRLRITFPRIRLGLSGPCYNFAESYVNTVLPGIQEFLQYFLDVGDERFTKILLEYPAGTDDDKHNPKSISFVAFMLHSILHKYAANLTVLFLEELIDKDNVVDLVEGNTRRNRRRHVNMMW